MKRWACISIFEVKGAISASSIARLGIIIFLSDSNNSNIPLSYIINFYPLAKFSYLVYDFMKLLSYHFF